MNRFVFFFFSLFYLHKHMLGTKALRRALEGVAHSSHLLYLAPTIQPQRSMGATAEASMRDINVTACKLKIVLLVFFFSSFHRPEFKK